MVETMDIPPERLQLELTETVIMDDVEGSHWWFVGRRAILETFMRQIVNKLSSPPVEGGVAAASAAGVLPRPNARRCFSSLPAD